jgi:exosortase D (VPLPA-CTERM-specific)
MNSTLRASTGPLRPSGYLWILLAIGAVITAAALQTGIAHMIDTWLGSQEYSHALLIPVISAYLLWQQRAALARLEFNGSWLGLWLVLFGTLLQFVGVLAAVDVVQQYGLLLAIYGLVLALIGLRASQAIWAPLLLLVLMIPLPQFLLQNLSAQLQLISSQIGVWFIRLFGISVFVEGNVIDLGTYKLQVAEACDGLRYLFPLMTMGFIMAYMFKTALWKRVFLFASTIPLTVLMNSFRIGTIGVMVEHWGVSMAEGFLHEFQGWAVFMSSAALLLVEVMILARVGKNRRPWRELFGLEVAVADKPGAPPPDRHIPAPFVASAVVLAAFAAGVLLTPERVEAVPARETFASFPNQVAGWTGRRTSMEQIYLDTLKLDDYIMADYAGAARAPVNFYVAWYSSQRAGQSAHSPRSCLPGGGWRISSLSQVGIPGVRAGKTELRVNRVQIEMGNQRQLVYYWFQQRGRVITNEYQTKWYLFWDSLTQRRTDGALVRLITPLAPGEAGEDGDKRLAEFAGNVAPRLDAFVPD